MSDEINNDWQNQPDFPVNTPPEQVLDYLIHEIYRRLFSITGSVKVIREFSNQDELVTHMLQIIENASEMIRLPVESAHRYRQASKGNNEE